MTEDLPISFATIVPTTSQQGRKQANRSLPLCPVRPLEIRRGQPSLEDGHAQSTGAGDTLCLFLLQAHPPQCFGEYSVGGTSGWDE
jgi:hypothetical protein